MRPLTRRVLRRARLLLPVALAAALLSTVAAPGDAALARAARASAAAMQGIYLGIRVDIDGRPYQDY
jgi:hypothetical protein